ncbi:MAG: hypothetical protein ACKO7P_07680 [Bacteroidota bacterium]
MKKLFRFIVLVFFFQTVFAQRSKGRCGVEVNDVSKTTGFGYLVAYLVQFKNTTNRSVDGIYWRAQFYNNDGDFIESIESSFNSTNIIDPISGGFTKSVARTPRVKGASKVVVVIDKVHFTDGESCK